MSTPLTPEDLTSLLVREPTVEAMVHMFARIHVSLIRAIEAEGYRVLVDPQGNYTLERTGHFDLATPVVIGWDVASGEAEHVVICGACMSRLRPDHRDGEACPVCKTTLNSI